MARRSLIGLEIAGYRIVEYLNQGGMASLWRAEHPEIGASVAVKVMAPELATEPGLVSRFVDEAKIQVKLRHPNIVRVENFSSEHFAILMELVEGKPLDEVIGRDCGPIPLARAMPLVRQILAAVEYAHGMGVVHRDLKPANILITVDGTAKVTDFGIAKLLGQSHKTRTGTSMGTPAYMAPEQIRGAKDADERADIYALGVTIYEMLAGRTPFEEERNTGSEFDMMQAQVSKKPPDPRQFYPDIPESVVRVLMRALEKDRDLRHGSIAELSQALEAADGMEGGTRIPASVLEDGGAPAPASTVVEQQSAPAPPEGIREPTAASGTPHFSPADAHVPGTTGQGLEQVPRGKPTWVLQAAIGGAVAAVLIMVLVFLLGGDESATHVTSGGEAAEQARPRFQGQEPAVVEPPVVEEEPMSPPPSLVPEPREVALDPEPAAPAGGGDASGCPTPNRPWVVLAMSVKVEASGAQDKANQLRDRLQGAGFDQASVCDGRKFPNFRCCYWTVVAGSYASRAPAVEQMRLLRAAGFDAYPKNAFKGKRAR